MASGRRLPRPINAEHQSWQVPRLPRTAWNSLSTSLPWEPTGGAGSQAPPNSRAGVSASQDPQEVLRPEKHFCGLNRGHISIHMGEADAQGEEAGPGSHSWFQPWFHPGFPTLTLKGF